MKLLINLSTLGAKPTGLGVYAGHCATAALRAFDAELIASPEYAGEGHVAVRSPHNITLGSGRSAAVRRWFWAKRFPPVSPQRLVYSPTHQGLGSPGNEILTIHDLITLRFPSVNPLQSLFFRRVLPGRLRQCRAVFAVSHATKIDVHERFGYPLEKIHVVPNGVDTSEFKPAAASSPGGKPFLLMVGASLAHKNADELLDRAEFWAERYSLTIVASQGRYRRQLEQIVQERKLTHAVTFLDYVTRASLLSLYQTCAALVYPSKWEGFGIPPLEALACGARIIASDIAPHREVLGDAAQFVRLGDRESWGAAFAHLDSAAPLSPENREATLARYSWSNSARALRKALLEVEPRLIELRQAEAARP